MNFGFHNSVLLKHYWSTTTHRIWWFININSGYVEIHNKICLAKQYLINKKNENRSKLIELILHDEKIKTFLLKDVCLVRRKAREKYSLSRRERFYIVWFKNYIFMGNCTHLDLGVIRLIPLYIVKYCSANYKDSYSHINSILDVHSKRLCKL